MTSVSLVGTFAPATGARDGKMDDDNALASFAGMLAGANQANARPPAPTAKSELASDGTTLENTDESGAASDANAADDSKDTSSFASTPSADAATASAAATSNPNAIDSSIAALNPALQEKLGRVISRMREETGHDVQVTETYRSQSRQNALYAQGRQAPGSVVTWTQHSKHTQGRAVDVTLDGGRAGADAYTALQRIANEEGLRTLGAKDPGHLELPSNSAAKNQTSTDVTSVPAEPADASGAGQVPVARLAQLAQVASVAQVATVARAGGTQPKHLVDTTSRDGSSEAAQADDSSGPVEISNLERLSDAVNATRVEDRSAQMQQGASAAKSKGGAGSAQLAGSIGRSPSNRQGSSGDAQSGNRENRGYTAMTIRAETAASFSVPDVATEMTSTASQHVERIMAAQDAPARPLSQIVMSVDNGNGTTDTIQVAMRGSTVSATIDAADHDAANALRAHSDELVRSLTRDGVDVDSVRVRTTATTATTAASVTTTVDSSRKSSDASNNSRFNREAQWDQQRSHQRSNNERRHQQREQRGGKKS